jgi:hypothetical protein
MNQVLTAIGRALGDLGDRRVVAIVLLPMSGAFAIWAVVGWWIWPDLAAWLNRFVSDTLAGKWIEGMGASWVIHSSATLTLIVVWVPAILITAMIITEFIAMPVIVRRVGDLHYPQLARNAGGTPAGGIINVVVGITAFCTLIVTLPLADWNCCAGAAAPVVST